MMDGRENIVLNDGTTFESYGISSHPHDSYENYRKYNIQGKIGSRMHTELANNYEAWK